MVFAVFLWQPCPANGENSWLMIFVAVELFDFRGNRNTVNARFILVEIQRRKCPPGINYWIFSKSTRKCKKRKVWFWLEKSRSHSSRERSPILNDSGWNRATAVDADAAVLNP